MSAKSYPNARDCEHGSQRRKCVVCELTEERREAAAWQQRAEKAEAQVAVLRKALTELVTVYDAAETRHDGILGLDWDSSPDTGLAGQAWACAVDALASTSTPATAPHPLDPISEADFAIEGMKPPGAKR